ncbi:4'-phosphopantetheinyl transferase superfamily protein [Flavobacterium sp. Fl-318]|uniref:4'-phosphopantetheinyl transferase superfamily protein n=1 Tax=Flavobacterium cupriresistens TaxID=2893885 RepID=A0ABU4RH67_9FLAO|nr:MULTISPECIES: 4'-phosphopantetheinyl transferase superfamily protein [unclassified Flavobacterium]MDX6191915.1 4'-phosphopantetheinyl transferase superfamily protein [Flavobacterium sp. Fl-318]UFH41828.1 4'-phosphopantetheinyl transferase superfamily protein [Flavobacterium sp. F-323]
MIHLFFTRFDKPISSDNWSRLQEYLSPELRKKSNSYRKWEDQHAFVLGRLLLMECLNEIGISKNAILDIKYNEFGKPFLNNDIDFNISHSGNFVICAIAQKAKLGIDIEVITPIDFKDYNYILTAEEWQKIHLSEDPLKSFFRLWTMKESLIKAVGNGLSIPLLDITIHNNKVLYDNKSWNLTELVLSENSCASVATTIAHPNFVFFEVDYSTGFKEKKIIQTNIKKIESPF